MEPIEFWKMSGSGNDFIVVDNRDGAIGERDMGRFVERACRRRKSVGADGVIFVVKSEEYDFAWRFFNADGGEVDMCGNGGRCVSRFAFLKGITGQKMTFDTMVGPISAEVKERVVKVLMPVPTELKLDVDMEFLKGWKSCDFINTGVPHTVVGVEDLMNYPVKEQGRVVRYHERFSPEGTNVNFVMKTGLNKLAIRTYERGVEDETLACGTGAIASALVASTKKMVQSPVKVKTQGGDELTIYFNRNGNSFDQVWLEGNTSIIYTASLNDEAL